MATQQKIREPIKEGPVRLSRGEYKGRNGEILKRSPSPRGNPFDFPDELKEDGWSYQWCRHSCYNNTDHSELSIMKRAGWREVSPDALNGYFKEEVPEGQSYIHREGLVLMERPQGMTDEAREEELRKANYQFAAQVEKRDPADEAPLPTGFVPHMREIQQERFQPSPQEWKPRHNPRRASVGDEN